MPVVDRGRALRFHSMVLGRVRTFVRTIGRWSGSCIALQRSLYASSRGLTGMGPAGRSGSALGVADVDAAHERLRDALPDLPPVRRNPGVIALLELHDPDGNLVVLWEDLLAGRVPVR